MLEVEADPRVVFRKSRLVWILFYIWAVCCLWRVLSYVPVTNTFWWGRFLVVSVCARWVSCQDATRGTRHLARSNFCRLRPLLRALRVFFCATVNLGLPLGCKGFCSSLSAPNCCQNDLLSKLHSCPTVCYFLWWWPETRKLMQWYNHARDKVVLVSYSLRQNKCDTWRNKLNCYQPSVSSVHMCCLFRPVSCTHLRLFSSVILMTSSEFLSTDPGVPGSIPGH
jgi:hypothetical protein